MRIKKGKAGKYNSKRTEVRTPATKKYDTVIAGKAVIHKGKKAKRK